MTAPVDQRLYSVVDVEETSGLSEGSEIQVPIAETGTVSGRSYRFVVGSQSPLIIGPHPVGFINQANVTIEECRAHAMHLCLLIDQESNIDVTFLPGAGFRPTVNEEAVRLLRAGWDDWFESSPGSPRLQFCAGNATATVIAALMEYEHASLISVVAIAPSVPFPEGICQRVVLYRAFGDLTSLFHSRGGHAPVIILPRHSESLGLFDNCFASSTFMSAIYYEWQVFRRRGSPESPPVHSQASSAEIVLMADDIDRFLSILRGRGPYLNNAVESLGSPPFPSDWLDWSEASLLSIRQIMLTAETIWLWQLFPGVVRLNIYTGVCVFMGINAVRGICLRFIPRRQNRSSILRTVALRLQFLEPTELVVGTSFMIYCFNCPGLYWGLYAAYGTLFVFLGPIGLTERAVAFLSPLRSRIQRVISGSDEEEAVQVDPGTNRPVARIGYAAAVQGVSVWGLVGGIVNVAVPIFFNLALNNPPPGSPSDAVTNATNTTAQTPGDSTDSSFGMRVAYTSLLVVYAGFSLASTALSVIRMRRLRQNRPHLPPPEQAAIAETDEEEENGADYETEA